MKEQNVYHPKEKHRNTHKRQKFLVLLSTLFFYVSQWQLDLWCSPYVWANAHNLEVLPFLFMPSTWAYCLGFLLASIAFWLAIMALWFWD